MDSSDTPALRGGFAARLRKARKAAGLSQAELGQALGVSAQSVKEWEAGRSSPHFDRLTDIARVTDRSPAWFFQLEMDGEALEQRLRLALEEVDQLGLRLEQLRHNLAEMAGLERPWSVHLAWAESALHEVREQLTPARHRRLVEETARGRWEREGG